MDHLVRPNRVPTSLPVTSYWRNLILAGDSQRLL